MQSKDYLLELMFLFQRLESSRLGRILLLTVKVKGMFYSSDQCIGLAQSESESHTYIKSLKCDSHFHSGPASVFFIPRSIHYLCLGVSALHNAKDGNLSYIQALAIQRHADHCLGIAAVTMVSTLVAVLLKVFTNVLNNIFFK